MHNSSYRFLANIGLSNPNAKYKRFHVDQPRIRIHSLHLDVKLLAFGISMFGSARPLSDLTGNTNHVIGSNSGNKIQMCRMSY